MKIIYALLTTTLFILTSTCVATAQTPTPTPSACQNLQTCVNTGTALNLDSCIASNPTCTFANKGKFVATASDLARNTIDNKNCKSKTTRQACNECYQSAKAPLRNRFFGKIFHGLLAAAVKEIELERKSVCLALPRNG